MASGSTRAFRHLRRESVIAGDKARSLILYPFGKEIQKSPRANAVADGWEMAGKEFYLNFVFYDSSGEVIEERRSFGPKTPEGSAWMTTGSFIHTKEAAELFDQADRYASGRPYNFVSANAVIIKGKPNHYHIENLDDFRFKNDIETSYT